MTDLMRLSMSRRTTSLTAAAAFFAVLLTGCATSTADDPEPPADTPAPDPADEPEPPTDAPAEPDPSTDEPADDADGDAPEPAGDCSASGATVTPVETVELPAEARALRDFLLDAAVRCDEQLLHTALSESSMFTYSFGEEGDAIGYWWDLEEAGDEPFLRLAQVLSTTPAVTDGLVVWPQVHTGEDAHTSDAAWDELSWLTDEERADFAENGYLGWRVGISADGEWRFFIRGD